MKKILLAFYFSVAITAICHSQVMFSKLIGKNSSNSKLGYGLFTYFDFPLQNADNKSIRIELLDLAFFPRKSSDIQNTIGYLSIKLGYKYVFSDDQAGFYVEPSAGYCRVVNSNSDNMLPQSYGDGVALAFEAGYSFAVGDAGNTFNLGLKYESDLAGAN